MSEWKFIFAIFNLMINSTIGFFRLLGRGLSFLSLNLGNERSRNVGKFGKMSTGDLVKKYAWGNNLILTSKIELFRSRNQILTSLVAFMNQDQQVPVVILHNGNAELEQSIASLPGAVICNSQNPAYSPFYNSDPDTIVRQLTLCDRVREDYGIDTAARNYIRGLAMLYAGHRASTHLVGLHKRSSPLPQMFADTVNEVRNLLNRQAISQNQARDTIDLLTAGQVNVSSLHDYLDILLSQFSSCMCTTSRQLQSVRSRVNITSTAASRGILCLDLSSVKRHEMAYALIASELDNPNLGSVYLVMDDINVAASPTLSRQITNNNLRLLSYCFSSSCISQTLSAAGAMPQTRPNNLTLEMVMDRAAMHIHLCPNQADAKAFESYYGTYRMQQLSYSSSHGSSTPFLGLGLPSNSRGGSYTAAPKDEHVWRFDQFINMRDNQAKVIISGSCYETVLNDLPS